MVQHHNYKENLQEKIYIKHQAYTRKSTNMTAIGQH